MSVEFGEKPPRQHLEDVADSGLILHHLNNHHGIDPNTVEPGDEESRHEQEHEENK